jgi:hypothetical protein
MSTDVELERICRAAERLQQAEVALIRALEANGTETILDALYDVRRELSQRKSEIATLLEAERVEHFELTGQP